jgi:hypothetical protein
LSHPSWRSCLVCFPLKIKSKSQIDKWIQTTTFQCGVGCEWPGTSFKMEIDFAGCFAVYIFHFP